jgi:hypothetical protein
MALILYPCKGGQVNGSGRRSPILEDRGGVFTVFEPHRAGGLATQQSDRLNQWLDRRHAILLPLFAVVLFVSLAARARVTPFWHDEIYTLLSSRLSPVALWSALRDGLDLMPPLNTILTHFVHAAAGPGPIASRLPALTGFVAATLVVVTIVRQRANAVTAGGRPCCSVSRWDLVLSSRREATG